MRNRVALWACSQEILSYLPPEARNEDEGLREQSQALLAELPTESILLPLSMAACQPGIDTPEAAYVEALRMVREEADRLLLLDAIVARIDAVYDVRQTLLTDLVTECIENRGNFSAKTYDTAVFCAGRDVMQSIQCHYIDLVQC